MNIEQITPKNFRRFAALSVTLHPQLTVLVASNGAGKLTILDAIAVAVSPVVVK